MQPTYTCGTQIDRGGQEYSAEVTIRFFGDALRIATAPDATERDRLRAKLRKRMPLHQSRWMDHGQYEAVAFMLHADFPRPEGPPSRLIETAWNNMPEIARRSNAQHGWDIAEVIAAAGMSEPPIKLAV